MNRFFREGDLTDLSLYLIGMAAVGAILIAIGAR